MRVNHLFMAMLVLLGFSTILSAQVPQLINFQGQLNDANGDPANGVFSMVFEIYDTASGGTVLWTETQSVTATGGVFNVLLGSVTPVPLSLFASGSERFLQITVDGNVLTPRRQFASIPSSFTAGGLSGVKNIDVHNSDGEVAINLTSNAQSGIINTFATVGDAGVLITSNVDGSSGAIATVDRNGDFPVAITTNTLDGGEVAVFRGGNRLARMTTNVAGNGFMALRSILGHEAIRLTTNLDGDGSISLNSSLGDSLIRMGSNTAGHGNIEVIRNKGAKAVGMGTTAAGDGTISTYNRNDKQVILMTTTSDGAGVLSVNGNIRTTNVNGTTVTQLGRTGGDAGDIRINYPNGSEAANMVGFAGQGQVLVTNPNGVTGVELVANGAGGNLNVWDSGSITISLNGATGSIIGNTKSFRMEHPLDPSKEIYYVSLEGPEAGVYARGTAQLTDGKATVPLPDHFPLVAIEQGMTVHLTPNSALSEGLAVVSKTNRAIGVRELRNGRGTYKFDYIVHAVRKGYENFQVVRDKVKYPTAQRLKTSSSSSEDSSNIPEVEAIAPAKESVGSAPSKSLKIPSDAQRSRGK